MSLERKRGGERKNYMLHLSFQLFSTFSHSLPNPNLRSSLALCSHGAGDVRSLWVRSMQTPPLLKLAFYQRYTVSTAITEPTEAKRLHARSLALTRLAGTLKRQRRRCRMPWWCVCVWRVRTQIHKLLKAERTSSNIVADCIHAGKYIRNDMRSHSCTSSS